MYTVSIVANQELIKRTFADFIAALDFVKDTTGHELCALRAYGEVINGRGVMMHTGTAFVTVARYH